jgi:hypothetical protein
MEGVEATYRRVNDILYRWCHKISNHLIHNSKLGFASYYMLSGRTSAVPTRQVRRPCS